MSEIFARGLIHSKVVSSAACSGDRNIKPVELGAGLPAPWKPLSAQGSLGFISHQGRILFEAGVVSNIILIHYIVVYCQSSWSHYEAEQNKRWLLIPSLSVGWLECSDSAPEHSDCKQGTPTCFSDLFYPVWLRKCLISSCLIPRAPAPHRYSGL